MRNGIILLLLLTFNFSLALAQTDNDPMGGGDNEAIDTLNTHDKYRKVILFKDNTWAYLELDRPQIDEEALMEDWESASIHAYTDEEITAFPDSIPLILVDSLHSFVLPITGKLYSRYGYRRNRPHRGVDIPLTTGDSIHAAFDGIVRIAEGSSRTGGYGKMVIVRHPNGLETYYGHLSQILVKEEEPVHAGEVIGLGGNTGRSTGPHLHFETRYKGKAFDPERIVDFEKGELRAEEIVLKKAHFSPSSSYRKPSSGTTYSNGATYHTIRKGDCLSKIASKYHTSVSKICKLNRNLTPNTTLQLGRKIRVR